MQNPKSTIEQVREFHEAFGVRNASFVDIGDKNTNKLRVALIREELNELEEALEAGDPVAVLDALADLTYVVEGSYLAFGLAFLKDSAFNEVHRSNMSKLGADGKPIYHPETRKVLKGPNYSKPDLRKLFAK